MATEPLYRYDELCHAALSRHGDYPRWQAALDALPETRQCWRVDGGVLVGGGEVADLPALAETLKTLIPWRKGPMRLGGVLIDSEWRSDWKWNRVAPHIDLAGRRVLDVGAGNGYYGWRMLTAGARSVIGCDPGIVHVMQHRAVRHFAGPAANHLLPLRLEDLPAELTGFDTVFSMGVLYHRRDPMAHLRALRTRLRPGGQLVLETLVLPGDGDRVLRPEGRYANMRNVHALPTQTVLDDWLDRAGFRDRTQADLTPTTPAEQRSTDWMPFHSLAEALGPDGRTVEHHPPPTRLIVVAR